MKIVDKYNSLQAKYPEIAKQFHPTKNIDKNGDILTAYDVSYGSSKKYWWLCANGKLAPHEWMTSINNRTIKQCGCPICFGRTNHIDNCLAVRYPEIAKMFHPTKNVNKNGKILTAYDVHAGSHQFYWWLCPNGKLAPHEWEISCDQINQYKVSCPICAGSGTSKNGRRHPDNSLAHKFPDIAKELHPTKNGKITSNMINAGTRQKYWWICPRGHAYESMCYHRTGSKSGCPTCKRYSRGEEKIQLWAIANNVPWEKEVKYDLCKLIKPLPFDFLLFNSVLVEYNGEQHYKPMRYFTKKNALKKLEQIKLRDKIKGEYCKTNHIPLIVIPYWDFHRIDDILTTFKNIGIISISEPPQNSQKS